MLTVIVITDEPLMEAGIRSLLNEASEMELVCVCRNMADLATAASEFRPDVIFCAVRGDSDIALPDLRHASPRSAIVLLGREFSPEFAHQALEMGIRGFISSTASGDALRDCLRKTAQGELWMEKSLSMMLLDTRPVRLSKRQFELVRLLAQGLKNKEIATVLGISEGTVKAYLTALFEKVGAKDRFELALFGLKHLKNVGGDSHHSEVRISRPAASSSPPRAGKSVA